MIISKYNKSYDTADGSEQPWEEEPRQYHLDGRAAQRRREDDGGPLTELPEVVFHPLAWKPAWSVLSLRDLNEAIRRENCLDDPMHQQQEADRIERNKLRAMEIRNAMTAAAARAERDVYRNAWEHT